MSWWQWVIVALAAYLLISMTPWIVLQIVIWRIRRRLPFMAEEARQLERLMQVESEHAERWPQRPRPGRYQEVDRQALEQLLRMRVIISQANDLWPAVASYAPEPLNPLQVLAMGAWRPLSEALRIWRDKRRLNAYLDEGEEAIAALLEQWTEAQAIPGRIQAELSDARAEARRLRALWEGESEAGTRGIQALGDALALVDRSLGEALDAMRDAAPEQVAATSVQSEEQLAQATATLQKLEQELSQVIEARRQAAASLAQAHAGLQAAQERWQQLQAQGARDPAVAHALEALRALEDALQATAQEATPQAYRQVLTDVEAYLAQEKMLGEQMDALEAVMQRSREALEGDVVALAAAQEACAAMRSEAGFAPDLSDALVAQAQEIYAQAEEQRALGTLHSYQTAISMAEQAAEVIQQATDRAQAAAQDLEQIRAHRQQAAPEIRQALHQRAESVHEALGAYAQHWDAECDAQLQRVWGLLQQAEAGWSALPPTLLGEGLPRQSELESGRQTLQNAAGAIRRARQLVEELEGRLARVNAQRQALEAGLAELDGPLGQRLQEAADAMLPELRERYQAWLADYQARRPALQDPAQIDYAEAADRWLPTAMAEAREILAAHDEDVARYRKAVQEAQKRLERDWQRLQKLDPMQMPLPDEDLERLSADYAAWQAAAEASQDDPAAMAALVGRRLEALERRIESARRQINEGRQALATLDRQFEQQMQSARQNRAAIHALMQESQWRQIDWSLADGEPLVQRALTYQEASRQAETLDEAVNQMRHAVNTAEEALQAYQGMEQQLRSAQDKLNREFRTATAELDRAQRQAGQLRAQGPSEALAALERRCADATSLISMSQNAATFDAALRYLLDAQERLARG